MPLTGSAPPAHGWLVIGSGATIVAADAAACVLFGVRSAADLMGHVWTSLAPTADEHTLNEALAAMQAGQPWRGILRLVGATSEQSIDVEIVPTDAAGGVSLMHLHASSALVPVRPTPDLVLPASDDREHVLLQAQLEAMEAIAALPETHASARAVLHALRTAVPYAWGAVFRFGPVHAPPGDIGAEVVAVYPTAMAGIDHGTSWSPLDLAQSGVLTTGQPELITNLASEQAPHSPLGRLPGFGMTSSIHVPLYAGAEVAGSLLIYSSAAPLTPVDGLGVERIARALGPHLAEHVVALPGARPASLFTHASTEATIAEVTSVQTPVTPLVVMETPPPPRPSMPPPSGAAASHISAQRIAEANAAAVTGATAGLSALSEVISGVAHELNNPLTAILGYAQIFNSLDGAERDHAVTTIEHEAQRAARIVRNLLSFARQAPPTTSRVDVEEIVRRVVEVMRYSLEVDNIRVELRLSGIPEIEADRAQLEQVFLNLVNNAQQALQPGGGEIVISTTHVSDFVRVSVADDGPGVPEEMRDRVFQPFFTTRDVGLGQGMGLSTAYGLVTQHGGRVWVEPSASGGANFIVELPVHIADRAPEESSRMIPSGGGGERILVVDDELPIRALTSEILNHAGYRVTTAASGDEALRRLETVMFDLVVADMRMPGMDGAELYEHICDRWPSMERRVLFVTGDIDGARTSRRLARGDVRFLEKPFDTSALLGAIRAALDELPSNTTSAGWPQI